MEFDLVGVDAPIANAFRRIMISEVRAERDPGLRLCACGSSTPQCGGRRCPHAACAPRSCRCQPWRSRRSTYTITRPLSWTRSWRTGEPSYPQNHVGCGWGIRNGATGAARLRKILVLIIDDILPTKPCRARAGDKEWRDGCRTPTQDPSTNHLSMQAWEPARTQPALKPVRLFLQGEPALPLYLTRDVRDSLLILQGM